MPLTDAQIKAARPSDSPIKLTDGNGLYLEVRPSGVKVWRYRYRLAGKENLFAMGEYGAPIAREAAGDADLRRARRVLTLSEARAERERCRGLVKSGVHPVHQRKLDELSRASAMANTFRAVAGEWIAKRRPRWTPYYLKQVETFLASDVYPKIGDLPIADVEPVLLLEILQAVEGRGASTVAINIRQWCSAIFRYAIVTQRAKRDVAADLRGFIERPKIKHHRPLTRSEIATLHRKIDESGGYRTTAIALRLLLLTFVRTVELRAAQWQEIDLERVEWRIPAERMKMREPHIVPLSRQAVALLTELKGLTGGQTWLFPNYRRPKTCMTATTLNRALERMGFAGKEGIGFSAHGFRATASTFLNEEGKFRPPVIERQLAHKERNAVAGIYNQAEYLPERREMMQWWADSLESIHG